MNKGAYILFMQLPKATAIMIGTQKVQFPRGYYAYVRSVRSGLDQLVARHSRRATVKKHHIDYLLAKTTVKDLLVYKSATNLTKLITTRLERNGGLQLSRKLHLEDPPLLTQLYFFPHLSSMAAFVK